MPLVPLIGTGAGYKSRTVSAQRRQNLYVELAADADKGPIAMYGTPGLTLVTNQGGFGGPVRGATTIGNKAYIVIGSGLLSLDMFGSFSILRSPGALSTSTGRVSMVANGNQILIVDGTAGYIYNISGNTFTTIVDANFPNGCTTCCFLGGYFIVEKPNTGQFWWSNIYDGTTWNALQFATAETNPDNLVAVSSDHGVLYLYGERTVEFWAASGTTSIFQRIGAAGIEWGLAAKYSLTRFGDDEMLLSQNRMGQFEVIKITGFTATSVGTPDIINDMNRQGSSSSATAYSYMIDKHQMYQINFTTKSYLYDGLSNCWSEVISSNASLNGTPSRGYGEVNWSIAGNSYVSDYRDTTGNGQARIYLIDPAAFHEGDTNDEIEREWETKHVFANLDRMTVKEFVVEMEAGTVSGAQAATANSGGTVTPTNPQVMLQWSKDGGFTWGSEIWKSMGKIGQYLNRAQWFMLGRSRDFVFKLRISDPVKVVISNITMEVG